MSSCAVNRWGPGTTCERPKNTEAVKEMKDRMAALQAERAKQDQMWIIPESVESQIVKKELSKPNK